VCCPRRSGDRSQGLATSIWKLAASDGGHEAERATGSRWLGVSLSRLLDLEVGEAGEGGCGPGRWEVDIILQLSENLDG
jgi:hypothetical protein